MFRCFLVCLTVIIVGLGSADAQHRRQIDATPFAHAPCSVFDREPCTPTFCSVFNHGPCIPEIFYPYGQNLQLTVQTVPPQDQAEKYRKPDHDLDTIGDLFAAVGIALCVPVVILAIGTPVALCVRFVLWIVGML